MKAKPLRIRRREQVCAAGRCTTLPLDLLADPELTPAAKLVAAALLYCLHPGESWCAPQIAYLARLTTLGARTVFRAVAALEAAKWITVARHVNRANGYAFRSLRLR